MRHDFIRLAAAAALLFAGSGACAMSGPGPTDLPCTVAGAERLPADSGGADALCAILQARLAGTGASVAVSVDSEFRLSAIATTADGRRLDEVNVARSDRAVGKRSFETLGDALRDQIDRSRS